MQVFYEIECSIITHHKRAYSHIPAHTLCATTNRTQTPARKHPQTQTPTARIEQPPTTRKHLRAARKHPPRAREFRLQQDGSNWLMLWKTTSKIYNCCDSRPVSLENAISLVFQTNSLTPRNLESLLYSNLLLRNKHWVVVILTVTIVRWCWNLSGVETVSLKPNDVIGHMGGGQSPYTWRLIII